MKLGLIAAFLWVALASAQETHDHPAPEKLGTVSFAITCKAEVQPAFNRGVALLHSFAYKAADAAFDGVAKQDPECAMAHWGRAMTHYHQLWDLPPSPADTAAAQQELGEAARLEAPSKREAGYIHAVGEVFSDAPGVAYPARALRYEAAMHELAAANPKDVEAQVFYALALISNASPADRDHRRQKQAADMLEPLFREHPDHPGIPHYLIHACDNQEMAARGLAAARAYAGIAPSAPHALHMPSHIFTRLGLWNDSIESNRAARSAAQHEGNTGEELHAMDYLTYAYLQSGRDEEAAKVVAQLKAIQHLRVGEFKSGYAATAMPIRLIVEGGRWSDAEKIVDPPEGAPPHVVAIAVWARGVGFARGGKHEEADKEAQRLGELEERLRAAGNGYWATQVGILRREVGAWAAQAAGHAEQAGAMLRSAAEDEDGIEKLPVTPGPIVPAREQLGQLLLEQGHATAAAEAFRAELVNSPGRRGALDGAARAARLQSAQSVHRRLSSSEESATIWICVATPPRQMLQLCARVRGRASRCLHSLC